MALRTLGSFIIMLIVAASFHTVADGQVKDIDMDLEVTVEEKIIIFSGFGIVILGIFLFLARDILLRRKTTYDTGEYESKKERTYEKYHSSWTGDDYDEQSYEKSRTIEDNAELREAALEDRLPDYYDTLGVPPSATFNEIKMAYRDLAKKAHPDRTKTLKDGANDTSGIDSDARMATINKAYETLSDEQKRKTYDSYRKMTSLETINKDKDTKSATTNTSKPDSKD